MPRWSSDFLRVVRACTRTDKRHVSNPTFWFGGKEAVETEGSITGVRTALRTLLAERGFAIPERLGLPGEYVIE
jgi:hypothetical protein